MTQTERLARAWVVILVLFLTLDGVALYLIILTSDTAMLGPLVLPNVLYAFSLHALLSDGDARKTRNLHIGSSFKSFLDEQGIRADVERLAEEKRALVATAALSVVDSDTFTPYPSDPCLLCGLSIALDCRCEKIKPGYYHPDPTRDAQMRVDAAARDRRSIDLAPGRHEGPSAPRSRS